MELIGITEFQLYSQQAAFSHLNLYFNYYFLGKKIMMFRLTIHAHTVCMTLGRLRLPLELNSQGGEGHRKPVTLLIPEYHSLTALTNPKFSSVHK